MDKCFFWFFKELYMRDSSNESRKRVSENLKHIGIRLDIVWSQPWGKGLPYTRFFSNTSPSIFGVKFLGVLFALNKIKRRMMKTS